MKDLHLKRLQQKRCVVTGAARGIGAEIARRFAAEGGDVIVTDKDFAGANAIADEIGGTAR